MSVVDDARRDLGPLGEDECRALLETVSLGRLALSVRALPVVLPVDFVVHGAGLILRVGAADGFEAACDGTVVAFQVDRVDGPGGVGWSVLVQGRARVLRAGDELVSADRALSLVWVDSAPHLYVRLGLDLVTGQAWVAVHSARAWP